MKRTKIFGLMAMIVITALMLTACSGGTFEHIGAWSNEAETTHFVFKDDGTYVFVNPIGTEQGTYTVSGTELTLTAESGAQSTGQYQEDEVLLFNNVMGRFAKNASYVLDESLLSDSIVDSDDGDDVGDVEVGEVVDGAGGDSGMSLDGAYYYANDLYYTFYSDGRYDLHVMGTDSNGTYTFDGTDIIVSQPDDVTYTLTYDGSDDTMYDEQIGWFYSEAVYFEGSGITFDGTWTDTEGLYSYMLMNDGSYIYIDGSGTKDGTYEVVGKKIIFTGFDGTSEAADYDEYDSTFWSETHGVWFYPEDYEVPPPSDLEDNRMIEGTWSNSDGSYELILTSDGGYTLNAEGNMSEGTYVMYGVDINLMSDGGEQDYALFDEADNSIFVNSSGKWLYTYDGTEETDAPTVEARTFEGLFESMSLGLFEFYEDGTYILTESSGFELYGRYELYDRDITLYDETGAVMSTGSFNGIELYLDEFDTYAHVISDPDLVVVVGKWTHTEQNITLIFWDDGLFAFEGDAAFDYLSHGGMGSYSVDGDIVELSTEVLLTINGDGTISIPDVSGHLVME